MDYYKATQQRNPGPAAKFLPAGLCNVMRFEPKSGRTCILIMGMAAVQCSLFSSCCLPCMCHRNIIVIL